MTARIARYGKWLHRLGGPGLIGLGIAANAPGVSAPAGSVDLFVISFRHIATK